MNPNSEILVKRIQASIEPRNNNISIEKMFGGTCFLYNRKMYVGETKERLMVRVVSEKMENVLAMPNVEPMDFTGRAIKESVFVTIKGIMTEEELQFFIELGIEHAKLKSNS